MTRPGICRTNASRVAKNAACGPPYPIGTPNRCELPTTTSAPSSPGGVSRVKASRSVQTAASAPASWARATTSATGTTAPSSAGVWSRTPKTVSSNRIAVGSSTSTSMPNGSARPRTTSMVWGKQPRDTSSRSAPAALRERTRCIIAIASAAAVASSRSEALATGIPVRSPTIVW